MASTDISPETLLASLSSSLGEDDREKTFNTLETLFQNLQRFPDEDRYKRIRLANKQFSESIFAHPKALQFLLQYGWIENDGYLVFYEDISITDIALTMIRQCKRTFMTAASAKTTEQDQQDQKDQQRIAQLKLLKDHQKKIAEERKTIADKIRADREETTQKESRPSKSQVRQYGGNVNRFQDIGVDLNKGG